MLTRFCASVLPLAMGLCGWVTAKSTKRWCWRAITAGNSSGCLPLCGRLAAAIGSWIPPTARQVIYSLTSRWPTSRPLR